LERRTRLVDWQDLAVKVYANDHGSDLGIILGNRWGMNGAWEDGSLVVVGNFVTAVKAKQGATTNTLFRHGI
jgi:hypothetical protein